MDSSSESLYVHTPAYCNMYIQHAYTGTYMYATHTHTHHDMCLTQEAHMFHLHHNSFLILPLCDVILHDCKLLHCWEIGVCVCVCVEVFTQYHYTYPTQLSIWHIYIIYMYIMYIRTYTYNYYKTHVYPYVCVCSVFVCDIVIDI